MNASVSSRLTVLLAAALLIAGCSTGMSAAELDASYEAALETTAAPAAADLSGDPERLARAVANVQRYFRDVSAESVRELTRDTYAASSYLNDNLAAVHGVDAIEAYFLGAIDTAEALDVEFLSSAADGVDVYVRWRMDMTVPALNGGRPIVTYGVTQFRFDEALKVLLHRDFWDSGGGFYEHVPVLGRIVRGLRPAH